MGLIIFSISFNFAFAKAFAFLYSENNILTTFVVLSSFVRADKIVPIRILNGPPVFL
jgi:hypothetical protein